MVGQVTTALSRRGLATYVLASSPTRNVPTEWQADVDVLRITDGHALRSVDIDAFLDELSAADVPIIGCLTVWDAYRELMAYANRRLGAADLSGETVRRLRDKLAMRDCLREQGLSNVGTWPLDEHRYAALDDRTRYFVKPREGLASLGAFRADRLENMSDLDALWCRAQQDVAYAGVFEGAPSFIVEDFIDGVECSFEVSVRQGVARVHAVHEKVDLRASGRTTLENACVCPPTSLDCTEVDLGGAHVERCLAALGANTGVYHVEARFERGRGWEIVEVNPRIGGSYIVASTRQHSGVDLLEHWIDLLLGGSGEPAAPARRSTFFRVFYGESGRQIARLVRRPGRIEVLEDKLLASEGEVLPDVDREIFVGQALWDITAMSPDVFDSFLLETELYLAVDYRS